jgi:cysteinyl-tRNA synthetase
MSRKLEEFKPLVPGQVGFYSCGPTVYWNQHLGNMRTFINNDILKRMFIENGYEVKHVMNYTDVGHLTSDEDEGEDKMEKGAAREGKSVWEIAKTYIDSVVSDFKDLNLIAPITPRATDYIAEQINIVQDLENLGYTYIIPGKGVYYDTSKFANYGALGGQDLSKLRAGARIDDTGKRNPADFMLWAFSPSDKKREMEWDSPWGRGFPGWHIECSAMSRTILGDHFDIHTGGQEHIKVHHTDEIAQSEPIVGKPWVNYWIHYAWLMAKDGKMSKSAGDSLTVPYIKIKGYDPMEFRYLMLLGHYKQPVEFSWTALDAAAAGYKNIVRKVAGLFPSSSEGVAARAAREGFANEEQYKIWHDKILETVSDNLKTAEAIVIFQEMLRDENLGADTKIKLVQFADRLLGLQIIDRAQKLLELESVAMPDEIQKLAAERRDAKAAKDWVKADELRAQIDAAGWTVTDTKDGFKIVKKS